MIRLQTIQPRQLSPVEIERLRDLLDLLTPEQKIILGLKYMQRYYERYYVTLSAWSYRDGSLY